MIILFENYIFSNACNFSKPLHKIFVLEKFMNENTILLRDMFTFCIKLGKL